MAEDISKLDIKVEHTGGIRDDASLKRALDTGVQRVNIGTAALENPEWIARVLAEYGEKIAVDIAVRNIDGQWRTRGKAGALKGATRGQYLERLKQEEASGLEVPIRRKAGT